MQGAISNLASIVRPQTDGDTLAVYVVATTLTGAQAALAAARTFAAGFETRSTLLVPQVVPYPQSVEHPADSVAFTRERFRQLAEPLAMDVLVRVCLCRSHDATLAPLLPCHGIVLIGGRCRRWPTREQRMARALARSVRHVLFVREGGIITSCTSSTSFAAPMAASTPATPATLARASGYITAAAARATRAAAGLLRWCIRRSTRRGARRSAVNTG
jgi:hypothetical protein